MLQQMLQSMMILKTVKSVLMDNTFSTRRPSKTVLKTVSHVVHRVDGDVVLEHARQVRGGILRVLGLHEDQPAEHPLRAAQLADLHEHRSAPEGTREQRGRGARGAGCAADMRVMGGGC